MAEELKALIEKIQSEGVAAAEEKARAIEDEAKKQASVIIEKARREARNIVDKAQEAALRSEESGKASLKQAGRDLILSLRKEIAVILDKIVTSHVHKSLNAEEMSSIILTLVKESSKSHKGDIVISLKKEDVEKIERGTLSELRDEIKKGIVIKASDDIQAGFLISYDSGKSYYDFTDKALAKYIALYLNPKLAEILGEATS